MRLQWWPLGIEMPPPLGSNAGGNRHLDTDIAHEVVS